MPRRSPKALSGDLAAVDISECLHAERQRVPRRVRWNQLLDELCGFASPTLKGIKLQTGTLPDAEH